MKTEDSEVLASCLFVLIKARLSAKCTFKSASLLISSALGGGGGGGLPPRDLTK